MFFSEAFIKFLKRKYIFSRVPITAPPTTTTTTTTTSTSTSTTTTTTTIKTTQRTTTVFIDKATFRDPTVTDHNDPHSENHGMIMTSYDEVMMHSENEDDRWRDIGDEKGAVVTVNKPVEAPGHGDIKPRQ